MKKKRKIDLDKEELPLIRLLLATGSLEKTRRRKWKSLRSKN